jgi:hypothetical protein
VHPLVSCNRSALLGTCESSTWPSLAV